MSVEPPTDERLGLGAASLVLLLVGLLFWHDTAQWTDVHVLPLSLILPGAAALALLPLGRVWSLQGGPALAGAFAIYLILGTIALWRGWHTLDLALHQAPLTFGAVWMVVFARALQPADIPRFLRWIALLGTPVVALRMVAHSVLRLAHTPGEFRLLHSESDVVGAAVCLLILMVFAEQFRNRRQHFVWMAANVLVLFATFKRSAGLGFVVVAGLYLWFRRRDKMPYAVKALAAIGGVVALALTVAVVTSPSLSDYVSTRLTMRTSGSVLWRYGAWGDALELWLREGSPWFGVGYGKHLISILLEYSQHTLVHNGPLALLVHMGVPAVAAYAVLFAISLRHAARLAASEDRAERDIGLISLLASVFLFIFAFFNPALDTLNSGTFLWLFMALPLIAPRADDDPKRARTSGSALLLAVVAALIWVAVPKRIHLCTLYSQEAGGKLPYVTYSSARLAMPLRRGEPIRVAPAEWADAPLAKPAWTWLMPEAVSLGGQSLANRVVRITYNHAPTQDIGYNLLDAAGESMPGLRILTDGRIHELQIGEVPRPPRYFLIGEVHETDPSTTVERVEIVTTSAFDD